MKIYTMADYREEVKQDVIDSVAEFLEWEENTANKFTNDIINDALYYAENDATGNINGSYFGNREQAQAALSNLIWSQELLNLFCNCDYDSIPVHLGAETIDVRVRCELVWELHDLVANMVEKHLIQGGFHA